MSTISRHDPFAAIKQRNYRLFAIGWLPASTGLQMQGMALGWELYQRTGDPLALGFMSLARALPVILLSLPAGQIVDLVDRRRALISTQLGFALASVLLTIGSWLWEHDRFGSGSLGLWIMYILIACTSFARVFNGPSRSSLLPQIIAGGPAAPAFHNALTWNSGVFQVAAISGPILAGAIILITGAAWPVYLIAAIASILFAICATFIRPHRDLARPINTSRRIWHLVRPSVLLPGIFEGVRFMHRERTVFGAITLDLFAVILGGATALMPIYASDILHAGPLGLGFLRCAPFIGALLTAIVLALRGPFRKAGPTLLWSVAGFGACTIIFGISRNLPLSLVALVALGALDGISVVVRSVLVSVRTPDHLRGRVAAVNTVFVESSNELGGFESAAVAKLVGTVGSVVIGGIGTILVVIGMCFWIPELRHLGKLDQEAAEPPNPPQPLDIVSPVS